MVEPVSREWGYDRGLPVDRYYIERFLARHEQDVTGRVLEIGDNSYTRRFGADRVTTSDVLHVVPGNENATFVGDLVQADHIPSDAFDCIILTQTLQLDLRPALRLAHRVSRAEAWRRAAGDFPGTHANQPDRMAGFLVLASDARFGTAHLRSRVSAAEPRADQPWQRVGRERVPVWPGGGGADRDGTRSRRPRL